MTAFSDETGRGWLPLKYEDGPDFCTVTFATGAAFALTVHPERMKQMEAALSASPVAQEPVASSGAENDLHLGWLFFNPDTGTEWADSHPIESGECDDAEELRPATLNNLKEELLSTWRDRERDDRLLNGAIEFLLAADGITGLSKIRINGELMSARDVAQQLRGLEIGRQRRTPPAIPAGVGADEIARASNWKLVDGTMTTGESVIFDGSFIIAKVTRREDADLILALLSRGSGER